MATPPSILPLRYPLPDHILCQIAELTDLDTIWSLRRVCHATREAADRVLRPYLIEQRVVASPALILDGDYCKLSFERYTCMIRAHSLARLAFISLSTKDYSLRGQQLRLISQRFQRHLDTYTPSCTLVRKLTIEVRDDDLDTGWPQMARLASQLETLEIHIFDRFWHSVAWSDENEVYNEKIGANCVIERSWARLFNFNKPLATSSFLINLTSLTIQATARTFYHFRQIAPHVPGLRELTLGLHWLETDKDLLPYEFEYAPKFTLLNLHRITLIGLDKWMTSMLSMILLPSSPNLRLLDIRRLRNIVTPDTHHLLRLVQSIAQSPHLQGLVVYGIDSKDFLSKIIDVQRAYSRVLAFRNITTITIELTDSDGLGSDPLLQGVSLFHTFHE